MSNSKILLVSFLSILLIGSIVCLIITATSPKTFNPRDDPILKVVWYINFGITTAAAFIGGILVLTKSQTYQEVIQPRLNAARNDINQRTNMVRNRVNTGLGNVLQRGSRYFLDGVQQNPSNGMTTQYGNQPGQMDDLRYKPGY